MPIVPATLRLVTAYVAIPQVRMFSKMKLKSGECIGFTLKPMHNNLIRCQIMDFISKTRQSLL